MVKALKYLMCLLLAGYAAWVSYLYFFKIEDRDKEVKVYTPHSKLTVDGLTNSLKKPTVDIAKKQREGNISIAKLAQHKVKKDQNKTKIIPKNAVVIKLPEVPKVEAEVPKVITIGAYEFNHTKRVRLSTAMPEIKKSPKVTVAVDKKEKSSGTKIVYSDAGLAKLGRVSTYLRAKYIPLAEAKEQLKKEGFEIISTDKLDRSGELTVVTFSSKALRELAQHSLYLSNLRLLVDKKNKQITISNPYYFAKAFLGDKFNEKKAKAVLKKLTSSFKDLKDSRDKLKSTLVSKYHFMFGMPYYEDMIVVAKGKPEELLLRVKKNRERICFIQRVDKDRVVIGLKLKEGTQKFINNIGTQNALLLPYPIVVENGEAKILNPKYYISVSYPMLKMSQFMKISDTPDAIEAEAKELFK